MSRFSKIVYDGTELRRTADGNDREIQRIMYVVDPQQATQDGPKLITQAQQAFLQGEANVGNPYFGKGLVNLPIKSITGKQIARNLVELVVEYGGISIVGPGTQVASFETVTMSTKIYSATEAQEGGFTPIGGEGEPSGPTFIRGLPMDVLYESGVPIGENGSIGGREQQDDISADEISFQSTMIERPATRIKIARTSFGINPAEQYKSIVRTTGKCIQGIGGFFPADGTILFEGIQTTATTSGTLDPGGITPSSQLTYEYVISLLYDPNGFPMQYFEKVRSAPSPDGPGPLELFLKIGNTYQYKGWDAGNL